jgi:hypothetical protein
LPRLKNKNLAPMRFRTLSMALMQCHFDYSCSSWYAGIFRALKSKLQVYPERTTDHGQATGKLYHLRMRDECTLFVIYKAGSEPTPYW